ncbi:hypothetical protein C6P40_004996 [Pichia californica]|uniref:DUF4536 domain-containing protein n=1 Tax=Pichia californica TaxID=460514 RepID=A0A9P6WM59_9ASCO|nr:hypothetical protein C6P42_005352 [[Candida] californica]KAG0689459.1 hypothetical protein C6P40_004996 [[Candida] californica]
MIPSNILGVFTPPEESRPIPDEENCLACQVMGSLTCLAGGIYFMSEIPFQGSNSSTKKNPLWWKNSVKTTGLGLFMFGIYRGGEGWLWNKHLKYKGSLF